MKIIVTGGAGFIGSHVCETLISQGNTVICIDNFNNYYNPAVKEQNIKNLIQNPRFKLYREDICNQEKIETIFLEEKPEKIVHLAARAGVRASIENPMLYSKVNIHGTQILLEASKKHKIKNFVFASSSSVYGERKDTPFRESDKVDNPISPYAATKKACELLCSTYNHLYGLKITCLRFFTVYGPRGRPDMAISKFIHAIKNEEEIAKFGDGSTKRDYTYIEDIVQGIISALDKNLDFEIINLGNGNPIKLSKLIEVIESATGKKAKCSQKPTQEGDVSETHADISKAKILLNYSPKTEITEGILKTIKWLKEEKRDAKILYS